MSQVIEFLLGFLQFCIYATGSRNAYVIDDSPGYGRTFDGIGGLR